MKKVLVLIFFMILWAGIISYVVFLSSHHKQMRSQVICSRVDVNVKDSVHRSFLSTNIVGNMLSTHGFNPRGMQRDKIDTHAIESFLRSVNYVKDVDVYFNMDADLHIDLEQREPFVRFIAQGGYDFYLSDDYQILPISDDYVEYLPIVSGKIDFPFESDYFGALPTASDAKDKNDKKKFVKSVNFLNKLINFVKYVEEDKFWNAQIVQINITEGADGREPTLEIVPRIGSHTILMGHIDDYQTKMNKMRDCYLHGMDTTLWNKFSQLDIQYAGQIVAK